MKRLGIDPGASTGLGVWDCDLEKLLDVRTVVKAKAFDEALRLARAHAVGVILIEQNMDKVYDRPGQSPRAMLRIAKNVGQNIGFADGLARQLRAEGFTVELVPPKKDFTKWSKAIFEAAYPGVGRTSEHGRDAANIARFY